MRSMKENIPYFSKIVKRFLEKCLFLFFRFYGKPKRWYDGLYEICTDLLDDEIGDILKDALKARNFAEKYRAYGV